MNVELVLTILSFVIGAALTANAAHVFDNLEEKEHTKHQFLVFFPLAMTFFACGILFIQCPNKKIPYIVLIVVTGFFLTLVSVNELYDNNLLHAKLQTKYHESIDFPIVRIMELAAMILATYVFVRKFVIS